jgi:glycogen(starch) synthase
MASIIMLTWEYPPHLVGGLSRHVHALSKALAARGHHLFVLTRQAPGLPDYVEEDGVKVLRVYPYFQEPHDFRLWVSHLNFALLEQGVRLVEQIEGPVLLHAHDWLVAHAAKGLKELYHLPLIATIHATEHGRHGGIHDPGQQYINDIEWWLTYEAWRVIVCSCAMRTETQHLFGLSADKVTVIPNGIDLAVKGSPRSESAPGGRRLLFHIGRLVPEKGADLLLQAMCWVLRRHPVDLVIGGTGPYREHLERRTTELGLGAHVHFAGWLDDVRLADLYACADAAIVPSTYEPFGIVALEAMAAGTPLVASDVGGLSEIITHERNGLKARPGDPIDLARQIGRLLADPALAAQMAAQALADVEAHYSWSQIAAQTEAVYEDVLANAVDLGWGRTLAHPPASGPLPGRYTI